MNYDLHACKQFLEPKLEAMRMEQYFRVHLDDNAVLHLCEAFREKPTHFQMFIYMFWAEYWDKASEQWKCVDASASVVQCCHRFLHLVHILPEGMMPCPVVD